MMLKENILGDLVNEIPELKILSNGIIANIESNMKAMINYANNIEQYYLELYQDLTLKNDAINPKIYIAFFFEMLDDISTLNLWYNNFNGQREKIEQVETTRTILKDLYDKFWNVFWKILRG